MEDTSHRVQFTLKIEKMRDEANINDAYGSRGQKDDPKWGAYETLDFKGLSGVEVIRKVLDYLNG